MKWFLALCLMTAPVAAHDWFTGTKDPVTNALCCSGFTGTTHVDCKEVPKEILDTGAITETSEGYRVKLTLEQAKYFNDTITEPVNEMVEWKRVQPGLAKGIAVCLYKNHVQCFFVPSNT